MRHSIRDEDEKDPNLTETGRELARQKGVNFPMTFRINKIYCSPYKRCVETAECLNLRLPIEIREEIIMPDKLFEFLQKADRSLICAHKSTINYLQKLAGQKPSNVNYTDMYFCIIQYGKVQSISQKN
jgi:broad specificity phosphatase PhoE